MGLLCSFTAAISGMLGPRFIGALMQGYAFAFVLVGFVRFICLVAIPESTIDSYFWSTILYFSLNAVMLIAMSVSVPVILTPH